jgi:hypothetical protein
MVPLPPTINMMQKPLLQIKETRNDNTMWYIGGGIFILVVVIIIIILVFKSSSDSTTIPPNNIILPPTNEFKKMVYASINTPTKEPPEIKPITTCTEPEEQSPLDKCYGNIPTCVNNKPDEISSKNCNELYKINEVSDEKEWNKKCSDIIGDPSFNNIIKCIEIDNKVTVITTKLCPKEIPADLMITDIDRCKGILKPTCVDNKWVKGIPANKCTDVYNEWDGIDSWKKQCNDKLGDPNHINDLQCIDVSGGAVNIVSKKLCPKEIPAEIRNTITEKDRCNGLLQFKCTDKGWEKDMANSCSDIYKSLNLNSEYEWNKKCNTIVGDQSKINIMRCKEEQSSDSTKKPIISTISCSKTIPDNMMTTDIDRCNGLVSQCTSNGWIKTQLTNCADIYQEIGGVGSMDWNIKCKDIMGDTNYINNIKCTDVSGAKPKIETVQLCPKKEPVEAITPSERCEGIGWVCSEENKEWIKDYKFNTCDKMYGYIMGLEKGTQSNWMAQCKDKLGPSNTINSNMRCVDTVDTRKNKVVKGMVDVGCNKNPPKDACKDPSGNDGRCPIGMVCMCDGSNNKWSCVAQKQTNKCIVPEASYCKDKSGNKIDAKCIQCSIGTNGEIMKEMICPGSTPSSDCMTSLYGVKQVNAKNKESGVDIPYFVTSENLPVYPLIDNNLCKENKKAYNDMTPTTDTEYIGYPAFNNPKGWINKDKNGNTTYYKPNPLLHTYKNKNGVECLKIKS